VPGDVVDWPPLLAFTSIPFGTLSALSTRYSLRLKMQELFRLANYDHCCFWASAVRCRLLIKLLPILVVFRSCKS